MRNRRRNRLESDTRIKSESATSARSSQGQTGSLLSSPTERTHLERQLDWDASSTLRTSESCNGCGRCRSRESNIRMCPMFRLLGDEEASPRSKANLLRGVSNGQISLDVLTEEETKQIADYCFHCQMCRTECPAQTDIPYLAFCCKAAYTAAHGVPLIDRFLSRMDSFFNLFSLVGCPFNWILSNRGTRWLLDKMVGIPQSRRLPQLAKIPFSTRVLWSRRLSRAVQRPIPKVVLLVDTYGNFFDTKLPELAVKVLEHQGISVHVPPRLKSSGVPAIVLGNRSFAERIIRKNTILLTDLIRTGYRIITLEPASAVCLKQEYPRLIDEEETHFLAENVCDLFTFLLELHTRGQLRQDWQPLNKTLGYHAPCRSLVFSGNSQEMPTPVEQLLGLIPELLLQRLEYGCCGMGGTFGLKKKNFAQSMKIGNRLFSAIRESTLEGVLTDCSACKMQLEQRTVKPVVHPIKILAYVYGLTKELAEMPMGVKEE